MFRQSRSPRTPRRPGLLALLVVFAALSAARAPARPDDAIEGTRLIGTLPLDGELFHVQGLEIDGPRLWVTSVDRRSRRGYLHEFDRATGRFLRRIELTDGVRYHPGGISRSGDSLWVPVAEMRPDSSSVLLEIDAGTLHVRRRIRVADHIGCIAAAPGRLVAGNWDSRLLYVIDPDDPRHLRAVPNPSRTHYQDMKFEGGHLVAGGNTNWWSGTVDWLDWPTMTVRRTLRAGAIGPIRPFGRGGPYTGEGMAIDGRDLYVVPEDGPSRVFRFRLTV
ncbi:MULTISPECIES: DUF6454 family protein [Sphingomonas]|jgi:hypothetical protein|uniref:DUF6454 family protein n=1 Tax=Sphingomonas TaxID=13687 RepID=UPI000A761071|nr:MULTISPECIES: DUF6454 family protein [Sphingomonas]MBY0302407.1 hypothetical protein [Sphingomonas ginsenosidimutans]